MIFSYVYILHSNTEFESLIKSEGNYTQFAVYIILERKKQKKKTKNGIIFNKAAI